MTADEKILALIKPEYLERVPRMFRGHATKTTVKKRLLKSIQTLMLRRRWRGICQMKRLRSYQSLSTVSLRLR